MSSFVLNRNYQLQLPNSFVEIDREEMEYVDGGFYSNAYYWGVAMRFTKSECADIAVMLGAGTSMAGIAMSYPLATIPAGLIAAMGVISTASFGLAANHDGMYVEYNYIKGVAAARLGRSYAEGLKFQIQW